MKFEKKIVGIFAFVCCCFFHSSVLGGIGDTLKRITVPVPAPNCCGIGIEVDCNGNLYYTNYQSPFLYKIDKNGNLLDTKSLTDAATGAPISFGAISWDNNRQKLWAGKDNSGFLPSVYLIDPATGVATFKFNAHTPGDPNITDGLAYDHSDSTVWISPDVSSWVDHFKDDGTYLSTLTPSVGGGNSVSGVSVGKGDLLYLGTGGNGQIVLVKKSDGSFISSFSTIGGRDEDLACDQINFAPKLVIWSKDSYDNTVYAIEVENGTCTCSGCITDSTNNPQTICNGSSYSFNLHNYTTSGTYYDTLKTTTGCDSIIKTILSVNATNPSFVQNISASICNGDTFTFPDGTTSTVATTHLSNLNPIVECDSINVTTLSVNPVYNQNISSSICNGDTFTFPDGTTSTNATAHTSILATVAGCDSTINTTLSVSVNSSYHQNITASICNGDSYSFPNGTISTIPTTNTSALNTVAGCDSIMVTTLLVNPVYYKNISDSICNGVIYIFPDGTTSGTATTHISNLNTSSGCDSIIVTSLFVSPDFKQNDMELNIFTPNGDIMNDLFFPLTKLSVPGIEKYIKEYNLKIFNRWGTKIFETSGPSLGWDGKTTSGSPAIEGVYFWILSYKSLCNENQILTEKGNVTLLR